MLFLSLLEHPPLRERIDVWIPVVSRERGGIHLTRIQVDFTRIRVSGWMRCPRVSAAEGTSRGYGSRSDVAPCIRVLEHPVFSS